MNTLEPTNRRRASRSLLHSPYFTGIGLATLALGVGANVALLFQLCHYVRPEAIVFGVVTTMRLLRFLLSVWLGVSLRDLLTCYCAVVALVFAR